MRKAIGDRRRAIKAALSALPSTLGLPHAESKEKQKCTRRITVETERTLIFRNRSGARRDWCAECGKQVQMASIDLAASVNLMSERGIYQLIESGAIHFAEDSDGRVLVCLDSLCQKDRIESRGL